MKPDVKPNEEVRRLLSPEVEEQERQVLAAARARDEAGRQAAKQPFPGPAAQAFSVERDPVVGEWTVRRGVDFDITVLSTLQSVFYTFLLDGAEDAPIPTGPQAWQVCRLMTRPPRETRDFLKQHGVEAFKQAAEEEFGFAETGLVARLTIECVRQIAASCATTVAHAAADPEGKEAAKSARPPSGERSTAPGG